MCCLVSEFSCTAWSCIILECTAGNNSCYCICSVWTPLLKTPKVTYDYLKYIFQTFGKLNTQIKKKNNKKKRSNLKKQYQSQCNNFWGDSSQPAWQNISPSTQTCVTISCEAARPQLFWRPLRKLERGWADFISVVWFAIVFRAECYNSRTRMQKYGGDCAECKTN